MIKNVKLPDNFDIIFSDSGKQKHLINEKKELETSYETQTTLAKEWCKTYDLPINI